MQRYSFILQVILEFGAGAIDWQHSCSAEAATTTALILRSSASHCLSLLLQQRKRYHVIFDSQSHHYPANQFAHRSLRFGNLSLFLSTFPSVWSRFAWVTGTSNVKNCCKYGDNSFREQRSWFAGGWGIVVAFIWFISKHGLLCSQKACAFL